MSRFIHISFFFNQKLLHKLQNIFFRENHGTIIINHIFKFYENEILFRAS